MPVRSVLKIGHPLLQREADPVAVFDSPELHSLINDMRDTMHHLDGAGLAAPQIGVSQQVVIFEMRNNPRYPDQAPIPETILINPEIEVIGDQMRGMWEGCLSVPGMRGYVERPAAITYRAFDPFGNRLNATVSGFHATVVQHECDHLKGVLYPQKISDMNLFGYEDALQDHPNYPKLGQ